MESARRFNAEGRYREAAIQYLNALKVDKSYPDAHFELSQAYEHLGRFDSASIELTRTVDLQPENYKARIDLGDLLLASGRTKEAESQANAVLAAEPNNPDLHALLSAIASIEGQKDKALVELHRALELDPNRAAFHEDLALLQDSDPANAASVEVELKKAVALDPKSVNATLLLADFYFRNNRFQDAEKISWDAVATDPKSLAARETVAQVILKEGDQVRAEQVLSQASNDLAGDSRGIRILADYFVRSGQQEKATAEFSRLLTKSPKNASVQKDYVHFLLDVKEYASARAMVAGLMKTSPKDPEVAALNGIVYLREDNVDSALNVLQEGARSFPMDASIQYWLGKAALEKGDGALAEKGFRRAAELNPSDQNSQQELARIASERGDMRMLAAVADKTIAAAPHFPGGYLWRANVERILSEPALAEADLKIAMNLAPQNPQPYLQLGELRFAQKRFTEGVSLLEKALQYDSNSVASLQLLIGFDIYQKQPQKALARVKAQIEKNPGNSRLYDLLSQMQMQSKNLDQAATTAAKALLLNSSDGDAVMQFAQIAAQRGQTANAIGTWEQWSNAHPNDADAFAILGTLEESRGDQGKAEAYYKKALQIQPSQPVAANNLAYRMLINGEAVDSAFTLAQTARHALPDSPSTADTLAWAYYFKGNYEFAHYLLEDAISVDPNNATMQYHLGMVYSKLSDRNNAVVHLKKAASLAPDSPVAKDARAMLQKMK
jgi:tetratricopeptide (TPR) repeat protein